MYIEMTVFNGTDAASPHLEICEFYGVRYNNYGFVVVETNHKNHDYVIPMDEENFKRLELTIRNYIVNEVRFFHLEAPVYRMKIGAVAFNQDKAKKEWKINILK
ncbi:MAG: hypothetical protein K6A23_11870 [Butyrivibrio sp.]|nr:hypothetical protein [Butyrivibrio sp.]